jgi:hypothetical protein
MAKTGRQWLRYRAVACGPKPWRMPAICGHFHFQIVTLGPLHEVLR